MYLPHCPMWVIVFHSTFLYMKLKSRILKPEEGRTMIIIILFFLYPLSVILRASSSFLFRHPLRGHLPKRLLSFSLPSGICHIHFFHNIPFFLFIILFPPCTFLTVLFGSILIRYQYHFSSILHSSFVFCSSFLKYLIPIATLSLA